MSGANAWASAYALSMVMWSNQQIVVGQCLVMDTDTLKTFVLYKLLMLSDVLILHIQLAILFCCHSVLLIHVIHPFHPHPPWVRFIVYSSTLLRNRFLITPHSEVARFLKSCCLAKICLCLCMLTKFGLG